MPKLDELAGNPVFREARDVLVFSEQMVLGLTSLGLYCAAAIIAVVLSVITSLFSILPWVQGDSPAYVLLWFAVFVGEGALLVPLCLSLTAELIERKVQKRSFRWAGVGMRFLPGLLMGCGPIVAVMIWGGAPPGRRSPYWIAEEIGAYCVSGFFTFLTLRIRRCPLRQKIASVT